MIMLKDDGRRLIDVIDGHEIEIRYAWQGEGVMRVNFVGVPHALAGRGLGGRLVAALVDKARAEGFRVVPVCSFAVTQFARHPDWKDVLA